MASIDICLRLKDEFNLINTDSKFNFTFNDLYYCDNYTATVLYPADSSNMVHVATHCYMNDDGKILFTRIVEVNYNDAFNYLSNLHSKALKVLKDYKKNIILEKIKQLNKDFI